MDVKSGDSQILLLWKEFISNFVNLILLNFKQSTPDFMLYGELGRYLMEIQIKTRMITYCSKLINGKDKYMQNYFMTWVLNYSKKIEETFVGLKISIVF